MTSSRQQRQSRHHCYNLLFNRNRNDNLFPLDAAAAISPAACHHTAQVVYMPLYKLHRNKVVCRYAAATWLLVRVV